MSRIVKIDVIRKANKNTNGKYILHFEDLDDIEIDFENAYYDCSINGCNGEIYTEFGYGDVMTEEEEKQMLENPNKFFLDNYKDEDLGIRGLVFVLKNEEDMYKFENKNVLMYIVKPSTYIGDESVVYICLNEEKGLKFGTLH